MSQFFVVKSFLSLSLLMLAALGSKAWADYPEKPIRLVVAFPAGTIPDVMARFYSEKLKDALKQNFIIDNRPGATGGIGADLVAKAPADGYTLLLNSSAVLINPLLGKQSFDFFKDLTPVVRTAQTPYALVVNAKSPINSLDQFVDFAKKNPGKVTCANYGVGSPPHLAIELLKKEAKLFIVPLAYNSSLNVATDIINGQVDCSLEPPNPILKGHVDAGRLKVIAHSGTGVMEAYPKADAFGTKYPQSVIVGWQAIFAPAATPKPILAKLHTEWVRMLKSPEITQRIKDIGFEPVADSLDAFSSSMQSEYDSLGKLVRETKMRRD